MPGEPVKILLTGPPGCGKTTAVRKIVGVLHPRKMAGFYTEEIRESGTRKGFRWHRLDGRTGILAHVDVKGPRRASRYGVDVDAFDEQVVPVLNPAAAGVELFVIDEIGKMECFSAHFIDAVRRVLDSDRSVLATVALKGAGFIGEVKGYPGTRLLHLTRGKRDDVVREVAELLK